MRERHDHQLAALDGLNVGPDRLDDPDRPVTHRLAVFAGLHRRVWPQVRPADTGVRDSNDRIGGID